MIRKYHLLFLCLFGAISINGVCQKGDSRLEIDITNLRNSKGQLLVSLFNSASGFPDDPKKAYRITRITLTSRSAIARFDDLPSGTYAIAILHDENNDQEMNKNFLGIPREGYGFSNNAQGVFGPPTWPKAGFAFLEGQKLKTTIRTRY